MESGVLALCLASLRRRQTEIRKLLLQEDEDVHQITTRCALARSYEQHIRPLDYAEEWIELYNNYDFFRLYRMPRESFNVLLEILSEDEIFLREYLRGKDSVVPQKKLLMTLRYLSSQMTYRQVGELFNVADSTAFNVTLDTIDAINRKGSAFIKWPNEDEARQVAESFQEISGISDVIGAIDGTHIEVKVPANQVHDYTNRKYRQSVILQGVCTSKKLFTNIYVGMPGRAHDARVLRHSQLWSYVQTLGADSIFYGNYHLLGDSAYPLKTWLMTPFKRNRELAQAEVNFNRCLSTARVKIENTFGWLKGRWRRLHHVDSNSLEKITKIITACCNLHNFCLYNEDDVPLDDFFLHEEPMPAEYNFDIQEIEAVEKRNLLMNSL